MAADKLTGLVRDGFNALNQIRTLGGHEPIAPATLRQRVADLIAELRRESNDSRDGRDISYALVALADEIAQSKPGRLGEYWSTHLLQMELFNENTAGVGFFDRLEALRKDHRRVEVLRVYYLALLFGFQGKYVGRPDTELRRLTESVGSELERALDPPSELSPDGARPDDAALKQRQRRPLVWVGLASLAASLGIYIVLRVVLDVQTGNIVEQIEAVSAGRR